MTLPSEDLEGYEPYPPSWMVSAALALCLIGLVVDIYLTYEHYTGNASLVCSDKGLINCGKVTTSVYSKLLGIPVADLGVAFFVGMLVLCLPAAWRATNPRIRQVRLLGVAVSMVMVLYLLYGELRLHAICLYCTGTHVVAFLLFIVVLAADTYVR